MSNKPPRDHHYAPQFYLRNFAVDPDRRKIETVAKNNQVAVWSRRSIEGLGYERDFYVHMQGGAPVSVEIAINRRLETPISASETWRKVTSGQAEALDPSDRPILYALIRHLHARTPHALQTMRELAAMAGSPSRPMAFSDEEHAMYAQLRASPDGGKALMNAMSMSVDWAADEYAGSLISILRSPIRLMSSTTPVLSVKAPWHQALKLPLPGQTPYIYVLPLDPFTLATLAIGDFDGAFSNQSMSVETALGFNQQYVGQFAFFDTIRHLIAGREGLVPTMTWAPYDLVEEDLRKIVFHRRPTVT